MKKNASRRYVVVLDDDPLIGRIIEKALDLKCIAFTSVKKLMEEAWRYHPVAGFIDIHVGGEESGLDVIPTLKLKWRYCPLLVITSDPTDEAVALALDAGADDFLQKPLRPKELVARLQTRLGDVAQKQARNTLKFGDITFDLMGRKLAGPIGSRYLSPTEAALLLCLVNAKGTVVSKDRLKRQGWKDIAVSDNALDRKIFELRRALKDASATVVLKAVYGEGLLLQGISDPGLPVGGDDTEAAASAPGKKA